MCVCVCVCVCVFVCVRMRVRALVHTSYFMYGTSVCRPAATELCEGMAQAWRHARTQRPHLIEQVLPLPAPGLPGLLQQLALHGHLSVRTCVCVRVCARVCVCVYVLCGVVCARAYACVSEEVQMMCCQTRPGFWCVWRGRRPHALHCWCMSLGR